MRRKLVPITNLISVHGAVGELEADKDSFVPSIALFTGASGYGKSTAIRSAVGMFGAILLKCFPTTNLGNLLKRICFELGMDAPRFNDDRLQVIIDTLKKTKTPLFVDEADLIAKNGLLLELLKAIHDEAGITVVLIGMKGIERKLSNHPQFLGRISQFVEFTPLDKQDAALMARELCEIELTPDLIESMHRQCDGNARRIIIALQRFETMAKANGLSKLDAATWANRPMFLGVGQKGKAVA